MMTQHPVVSRDEWLVARKQHLVQEKEFTRLRDRLSAERRELPWVRVDQNYVFDTPERKATLTDLFDGRSQLIVYHFMLTPGSDHLCDGCALISDHIDAARIHFEHNDLSFVAISRAPIAQIEPVKQRMGWRFKWVSSYGNSFNYDYHVSTTMYPSRRNKSLGATSITTTEQPIMRLRISRVSVCSLRTRLEIFSIPILPMHAVAIS
jgi:predicted dithiol-disulfide oxidoreductase (DUF899 family)